jgi:AraC-like DNA-binding protein
MQKLDDNYHCYLPVSRLDQDWGVYVTGVGCSLVPSHSQYPVSVHPDNYHFAWDSGRILHEYQIVYITSGEGEFESKSAGSHRVLAGTVLLLFPDEWHRYRPTWATGWQEYWLSFSGRHIDELVEHGFIGPEQPVLHIGASDVVVHPFLTAIDRVRTEQTGYSHLIAANVIEAYAATIGAVRGQQVTRRSESLMHEAKLILEQHAEKLMSIDKIAASFQLSEKHFRRLFKQETGVSPYQYHLEMRIYRAKEMLLGTAMTVKEISARLHFQNPFHFSHAFKQKTGLSPTQWRRGVPLPQDRPMQQKIAPP